MFKKGDKYIHFTKYGGVNKGVVEDIREINVWNTDNLCVYVKYSILTTKGVLLDLDGGDGKIYKINSEMTPKRAKELGNAFKKMHAKKSRPDNKKIHNLNEDEET
jgi:hypothetical protein